MKLENSVRREVVKNFKNDLKKYPFVFPHYEGEVIFDTFNHNHVCFARMCGAKAFEQVCPHLKELKETVCSSIGHENYCDHCKYDIRIDYFCANKDEKPELRLACDERLVGEIWKGFYGDFTHR